MADRSIVDFIEDWQTGFFVIIGSAFLGLVVGMVVGSIIGPVGFIPGFLGGVIVAFLAYSFLRYGH